MLKAEHFPRLVGWLLITLLLTVVVWLLAPQQLPVTAYKLSLVTLAGVIGYWLDRSLFPYARPDALMMKSDTLGDTEDVPGTLGDVDRFYCGQELSAMVSGTQGDVRQSLVFGMAMLRRAVIVGCAMLAVSLGA